MPKKKVLPTGGWRIWATRYSWVVQVPLDDGKWEDVQWYQTLESLALAMLEQRAQKRVTEGQTILAAVKNATKDVLDRLDAFKAVLGAAEVPPPEVPTVRRKRR